MLIVLAVLGGIFAAGGILFWLYSPENIALWGVLCGLVILLMIAYSLFVLRPERMILATLLGEIYELYSPTAHGTGTAKRGTWNTDIAVIFPPILAQGYIFPLNGFVIPFTSVGGNTKKEGDEALTPVIAFVNLTIRFAPNLGGLRRLVQALPVLLESEGGNDFTVETKMDIFKKIKVDGTPELETKIFPCIAKVLAKVLQPIMDEAVSRAVADFPLTKALLSKKTIEKKIKSHLKGTIVEHAGMLITDATNPEYLCWLFDVNLIEFLPADPDTAKAVSAEMRQFLDGKGKIANAIAEATAKKKLADGDAEYVRLVAAQAQTPEGKLALASQTLQKLPPGTQLIATPGVLDAVVAQVLSK